MTPDNAVATNINRLVAVDITSLLISLFTKVFLTYCINAHNTQKHTELAGLQLVCKTINTFVPGSKVDIAHLLI